MTSETYQHLNQNERYQIYALKESGKNITEIAAQLKRSKSTISREIRRGQTNKRSKYNPEIALSVAQSSKRKSGESRQVISHDLWPEIKACLQQSWSPEQIAGRLKQQNICQISHNAIYRYIYNHYKSLKSLLRHKGKRYKPHPKRGKSLIPDRVDISKRPEIVEKKSRIGDFEADTIVSYHNQGALVTLVDRASKYCFIGKVEAKNKLNVTNKIIEMLGSISDKIHTITYDNGSEFTGHMLINDALKTDSFFATPYHSWERGLNEHTNGLIREFIPKDQDLSTITQSQCDKIQFLLNNRPRKVLQFKTPAELFLNQPTPP